MIGASPAAAGPPPRRRGAGRLALALSAMVLGVVLLPSLVDAVFARRETRLGLVTVDDPDGNAVERATLTFRDEQGQPLARYARAGLSTLAIAPPALDWGRRAHTLEVEAYACRGSAPLAVERQVRGALLGGLAAHPVPRTVSWTVAGKVVCEPAAGVAELPLSRLVAELEAGEEPWAGAAVKEIGRLGPAAATTMPALLRALGAEPHPPHRYQIVVALGAMGPAAAASLPVLLEQLAGAPEPGMRRGAAEAADRVARGDARLAAALLAAARADADEASRERFLNLFGEQGEAARALAPAAIALMEDPEQPRRVRIAALGALKKTALPEARPHLERFATTEKVLW